MCINIHNLRYKNRLGGYVPAVLTPTSDTPPATDNDAQYIGILRFSTAGNTKWTMANAHFYATFGKCSVSSMKFDR